ncbi:MAG: hypothetical protein K8Q89_01295 [Nitrosarchaeum sp.]|nr:hypothetical protein [Nitrosarchaeum sp.]
MTVKESKKSKNTQSKCGDGSCLACNPLDKKLARVLSKLDYKDTHTLLVNLTEPIQHKISRHIGRKKIPQLEEANYNIGRIIGHLQIQYLDKKPRTKKDIEAARRIHEEILREN